ncbi:hypothetical protein PVAP13_1NG199038 [Panicum virgatum]|uniref:Uncharacterized protein n=1 Tax=Panicum virgatum TaxID=38727 RepID=A0A8T0WS77_PANVG|nr:hypothetical protein PVAP13_1NG199038 [Panicum virgatum]
MSPLESSKIASLALSNTSRCQHHSNLHGCGVAKISEVVHQFLDAMSFNKHEPPALVVAISRPPHEARAIGAVVVLACISCGVQATDSDCSILDRKVSRQVRSSPWARGPEPMSQSGECGRRRCPREFDLGIRAAKLSPHLHGFLSPFNRWSQQECNRCTSPQQVITCQRVESRTHEPD